MTTMNSNEREERLKQIRERWSRMNMPQTVFTSHCKGDIDFLLSLLDSQALRPTGWQAAQVAFDNSRMVKVVFETPECAEAFIDSIEPAVGPIVAATQMRDQCVAKLRQIAAAYDNQHHQNTGAMISKQAIQYAARQLESLTLDVEQKEAK